MLTTGAVSSSGREHRRQSVGQRGAEKRALVRGDWVDALRRCLRHLSAQKLARGHELALKNNQRRSSMELFVEYTAFIGGALLMLWFIGYAGRPQGQED